MQVVSARVFRANQSTILKKALAGESILISSRIGMFKLTPLTEEDSLTSRICKGLEEVKHIREGKARSYSVEDVLDEL